MHYKLSYLGCYAVSAAFVAVTLILYGTGWDNATLRRICETGVLFFGLLTVLNLFGRSFVANDDYAGRYVLNAGTTRCLSAFMFIVNAMTVYATMLHHTDLLFPTTVLAAVWLVTVILTLALGKLLKPNNPSTL